jgi:uncharacterized protein (TIGR00251 family)
MAADNGVTVGVRVHPGASREEISVLSDGSLDVRLRARPVEGQANERLIALLSERLGLRKRDVVVLSGVRSRQKVVRIGVRSTDELRVLLDRGHP